MGKLTLYFKNKAEYDAYWGDNDPSSKYLCIIEETELPTGDIVMNSAFTQTNNIEGGTSIESIGTSAVTYAYVISYSYVTVDEDYTELQQSYELAEVKSIEIKG